MKKQNLLFFPFLFALGIGLLSCNFGNGGNVNTFQGIPAVVTSDASGTMLLGNPQFGYLLAPELTNINFGDCLYLQQFNIDYDNQPSTQYYTASNIVEQAVNQSLLEVSDTVDIQNSTLPITNVTGVSSVYYNGKFFVRLTCQDSNPVLRLVYNTKTDTIANGITNLYLLAQSSSPNTSNPGIIHAFDLSNLLQSSRDTTITVSGSSTPVVLKYKNVNLNYLSSISDTGVPTFVGASQNPFTIFMFK